MATDGGLVLRDIAIERGDVFALRIAALDVDAGGALSVTGPNGAGKSTVLRMLAGLLPRKAGTLSFEGCDPETDRPGYTSRLHYLGHKDAVKPAFTAEETVSFWSRLFGGRSLGADAALDRFGLGALADVPVAFLSAGQRRRLALTRLVVAHRPLWLLDEPASGLDAASRAQLAGVLQHHRESGGIVVYTSHGELDLPGARALRLGAAA